MDSRKQKEALVLPRMKLAANVRLFPFLSRLGLPQDRKMSVQAAISRVMKIRKEANHRELVVQASNETTSVSNASGLAHERGSVIPIPPACLPRVPCAVFSGIHARASDCVFCACFRVFLAAPLRLRWRSGDFS